MTNVIGGPSGVLGFFLNYNKNPPREIRNVQAVARKNNPEYPRTFLSFIKPDSAKDVREHLAPLPQREKGVASKTMVSANAEIWLCEHEYKSREPQVGILSSEPHGGILEVNLTITPSGHDGPEKAKLYATENTYVARVGFFQKGHPKADYSGFVELDKKQFDGDGQITDKKSVPKDGPRWAATSPSFKVDLNQFRRNNPGADLVIQGWPSFSAGVGGYREARETQLKV